MLKSCSGVLTYWRHCTMMCSRTENIEQWCVQLLQTAYSDAFHVKDTVQWCVHVLKTWYITVMSSRTKIVQCCLCSRTEDIARWGVHVLKIFQSAVFTCNFYWDNAVRLPEKPFSVLSDLSQAAPTCNADQHATLPALWIFITELLSSKWANYRGILRRDLYRISQTRTCAQTQK